MSFAPFFVLIALAAAGNPAPEDARYVLHLADGRIVRAEVRVEPTGYSVRKGTEWTLIPSAEVLRATPLREVEQRLAAMRKSSAPGAPARVEVAHAALGEGCSTTRSRRSTSSRAIRTRPPRARSWRGLRWR